MTDPTQPFDRLCAPHAVRRAPDGQLPLDLTRRPPPMAPTRAAAGRPTRPAAQTGATPQPETAEVLP